MSCYIMYGGVTWKSAVLKVAVEVTKVYLRTYIDLSLKM